MNKHLLALLGLVAFSCFTQAQTKQQLNTANNLFKNTKEIYFRFTIANKAEIHELTKIISIDHSYKGGTTVEAYANKKEFLNFLTKFNYPYTILPRPNENANVIMVKEPNIKTLRAAVGAYPTYPAYVAMMQQFAIDYPTLCTYHDLGTLPSGHKILAIRISDNPGVDENEPEFLYTSTMHGDEAAGYPMMLSLIDHLLTNYGTDTRVTNLVNNMEIWINPLANPDGTYDGGDMTTAGAIRYNANGIDLNRNFPDPEDGLHPDGEAYQPETQIFMDFADAHDFVMSANFHGGAEVVNFPWDTWNNTHPDETWWVYQCQKWADTAQFDSPGPYMEDLYSGSIPGVTNGFDWYEVDGGRQDYMQWWHKCKEVTVELSTTKLIPDAQLINHYNYNLRSLINYMEASLYGIRGIVTDNCTGQPIQAKVFITGHDYDSSHVYSSLPVGNYHRVIEPGTYNVTYSAPGYVSQTITGVNVSSYTSTVTQNIALAPALPTANFNASTPVGCTGTIDFSDLTGSATAWSWDFGDGGNSTLQNPSHTYVTSGTYTVTLTSTNCMGTDSEIKLNYVTVTVSPAPTTVNDTATGCTPASLNLSASGSGTLNWYDAPTGGTLVNTGTTYTTPVISSTTTYYVESTSTTGPQYVGKTTNAGGGGYFTGATYHYLEFTATQPFTLVSVKVYANTTGARTIQLRNSAGTVLQSVTTPSLVIGLNTVTLNFNVPVGTNLQLGTAGGATCNLWRNNASAVYPYTIAGTVSITGNSAGLSGYYYYFYDWEINSNCSSARTPVSAVVTGSSAAASVSIMVSDNSICEGTSVTFTATPVNGGSTPTYQWQVTGVNGGTNSPTFTTSSLANGDTVTCILISSDTCSSDGDDTSASVSMTVFPLPTTPAISQSGADLVSTASSGNQWFMNGSPVSGATGTTFTPTADGTYYVIVTDGNGCASDTSNAITLTGVGIHDVAAPAFNLFPNPAQTTVTIETNFNGAYQLTLIDAIGKVIMSENCSTQRKTINLEELHKGIYFVQVKTKGHIKTNKLIVR
ncbi:MAG TPA: M14 family zinc carboxypeptidase [Flavobacteriales bacterium]|nr:M14 family zinc carboxypeptidase [Flavobacteriales bacterium]